MHLLSCARHMSNVHFPPVARGCHVGQHRFSTLCRGRKGSWAALSDECAGAGASLYRSRRRAKETSWNVAAGPDGHAREFIFHPPKYFL